MMELEETRGFVSYMSPSENKLPSHNRRLTFHTRHESPEIACRSFVAAAKGFNCRREGKRELAQSRSGALPLARECDGKRLLAVEDAANVERPAERATRVYLDEISGIRSRCRDLPRGGQRQGLGVPARCNTGHLHRGVNPMGSGFIAAREIAAQCQRFAAKASAFDPCVVAADAMVFLQAED